MMKCKMYRACLLMVAVAATVGGILCWCMNHKEENEKKGLLVNHMENKETTIRSAAKKSGKEIKKAATVTGDSIKHAAATVGHQMKHAAATVGNEWKEAAKNVGREIKHEFVDEEDA